MTDEYKKYGGTNNYNKNNTLQCSSMISKFVGVTGDKSSLNISCKDGVNYIESKGDTIEFRDYLNVEPSIVFNINGLTPGINMKFNTIYDLSGPINNYDAVNKKYVDDAISTGGGSYVPLTGGIMTGQLGFNIPGSGDVDKIYLSGSSIKSKIAHDDLNNNIRIKAGGTDTTGNNGSIIMATHTEGIGYADRLVINSDGDVYFDDANLNISGTFENTFLDTKYENLFIKSSVKGSTVFNTSIEGRLGVNCKAINGITLDVSGNLGVQNDNSTFMIDSSGSRNYIKSGIDYTSGSRDLIFMGSSVGSEKMVIKSDGNVGIGTLNPTQALQVNGSLGLTSSNAGIRIVGDPTGNYIESGDSDLTGSTSRDLYFSGMNASSKKMVIKSNGNVGIGTTNPVNRLDISGSLGLNCNLINDVSGINFCDGTYIGHGNSFDISTNEELHMKSSKKIIIESDELELNCNGTIKTDSEIIIDTQSGESGLIHKSGNVEIRTYINTDYGAYIQTITDDDLLVTTNNRSHSEANVIFKKDKTTSFNNNKITDVGDPTSDTDAVNKQHIDNSFVKKTGDTVSNYLTINGILKTGGSEGSYLEIQDNLYNGFNEINFISPRVDTKFKNGNSVILNLNVGVSEFSSGLKMNKQIDMNGNHILNIANPKQPTDAVNKIYIDNNTHEGNRFIILKPSNIISLNKNSNKLLLPYFDVIDPLSNNPDVNNSLIRREFETQWSIIISSSLLNNKPKNILYIIHFELYFSNTEPKDIIITEYFWEGNNLGPETIVVNIKNATWRIKTHYIGFQVGGLKKYYEISSSVATNIETNSTIRFIAII